MDAKQAARQKKLEDLLKQAAELAVEIQKEQQPKIPHFYEVEVASEQVGNQFIKQVREFRSRDIAAESEPRAECPTCGELANLKPKAREVTSSSGPLELTEMAGHCNRCRRSFFPSSGSDGT